MGSSSPNFRGENSKNIWVATTQSIFIDIYQYKAG